MSNLVYPVLPGLAFSVKRSNALANIVNRTPYGYRSAVIQQQYPRIKYDLTYTVLRGNINAPSPYNAYVEVDALQGFFAQVYGAFDSFLFTDPDYNAVTAQTMLVLSDGAGSPTYYTPLRANIGGFNYLITDLNPLNNSGLAVKDNGSTTTNFTIQTGATSTSWSLPGLVLKWNAQPTGPVTATFTYYMRCAFSEDNQDLEKFAYLMGKGLWEGKSIKFEQEFDNA